MALCVLRFRTPILAATLLTLIVASLLNFLVLPPRFSSTASVFLLNRPDEALPVSVGDLEASTRLINDVRAITESHKVRRDVAAACGLPDLNAYEIDTAAIKETRVIQFSVTGPSAYMTANIANEMALRSSMEVSDILRYRDISFLDAAEVPSRPSGPTREKNIVLSAAIAWALATIAAYAWQSLHPTLQTIDDVEAEAELPVLALLPYASKLETTFSPFDVT